MENLKACPICKSTRRRKIFEAGDEFLALKGIKKDVHYVYCQGCSVLYAHPRLDAKDLKIVYDEKYWETDAYEPSDSGWQLRDSFIQDRLRVAVERYHYLQEHKLFGRFAHREQTCLEIGSGAGFLLNIFKSNGWTVQGIEPTPLAGFARGAGIPTHQTFFDPALFPKQRFNLIGLMHVFEHLSDPVTSLQQFRRLLAPRGCLWLEIPYLFYPRPIDLINPHLFVYSLNTIRCTLNRAGFRILHCQPYNSRNAAFQVLHVFATPGKETIWRKKDAFKEVHTALINTMAIYHEKKDYAKLGELYRPLKVDGSRGIPKPIPIPA
jgi:SAM-dependent methyltransferase